MIGSLGFAPVVAGDDDARRRLPGGLVGVDTVSCAVLAVSIVVVMGLSSSMLICSFSLSSGGNILEKIPISMSI